MIPEPITLDGRTGTVVYLDAQWFPVSADQAVMARVLFDDGGTGFYQVSERVQPIAQAVGIGGITRKFDEAQHPRGEDGRFIEATQPRIFNRPEEVGEIKGWGGDPVRYGWIDKETGKPGGHLLTGEPIPREKLPTVLYHVTTNAPAVESSGVLLGQQKGAGLGGGQAEGVSFTSSKEDAMVIQRELRRAVTIARGTVNEKIFAHYARMDEEEARLPKGSLDYAVEQAIQQWEGNKFSLDRPYHYVLVGAVNGVGGKYERVESPAPPEERERLRREVLKDAYNTYLWARETASAKANDGRPVSILKNPLLMGRQDQLAKLDPNRDVQILEVSPEDIPAGALVTTGSDDFLHEVRVYADVPRRRKPKVAFDEAKHPREPGGTSEGGQFAETGRVGVPTSDPVLARQAKAGIAAVEKLLPKALQTADFSKVQGGWQELPEESRQKVQEYHREVTYDRIDIQGIDADLTVDVRWALKEGASPETAKMVAEKTKVWLEGYIGDKPLDLFAKDTSVSEGKPLDYKTLSVPDPTKLTDAGYPVLDVTALRHTDGTELTFYERGTVQGAWRHEYERVIQDEIEKAQDSDEYLAKRGLLVEGEVRKQWEKMTDEEKNSLIPEMIAAGKFRGTDNPYGPGGAAREPKFWKTGVEEGTHDEEDFARTHAIANRLTVMRTDQLRAERGLLERGEKKTFTVVEGRGHSELRPNYVAKDSMGRVIAASNTKELAAANAEEWLESEAGRTIGLPSEEVVSTVWGEWKRSSSEGLGLSLQLAAARELGGHHRMTDDEVRAAEQTAVTALGNGGMATLQAYVRAQWEVTQMVMQRAGEDKISVYRGLMLPGDDVDAARHELVGKLGDTLKPPSNIQILTDTTVGGQKIPNKAPWPIRETVTFDFNGEHFTVLKHRQRGAYLWENVSDEIKKRAEKEWAKSVYEVLAEHPNDPNYTLAKGMSTFTQMSGAGKMQLLGDWRRMGILPPEPFESTESAVNRRVAEYHEEQSHSGLIYMKLPEVQLQRSGAQSTTGTREVANDWGGVGNNPENPKRVVIRVEAPATSVLSLPVYGENIQEEHESVLLGTKDKWLWDAWENAAPDFDSQSIARKADTVPLVIDLQAEDRGKPHWMTGVNWSAVQSVAKFDEAKHPRQPGGTARGGEFVASQPILQGVDSKANAERETERYLAKWEEMKGKRPTPEALKAAEEELRALPLVHGTTVAGALGAAEKGLLSHADMEGQIAALKDDMEEIQDHIDNILGEERMGADLGDYASEDLVNALGLERDDAKALLGYLRELEDIKQVIHGTTNPADKKVGLDEFVFMTHGEKHPDYGTVAVVVDNDVLQHGGWASEKDIVVVPGGASFDDSGMRDTYNPRRVELYQRTITKGDDYYGVAAAHAGSVEFLQNRSREQLFEIKAPSVPKSAVKGFIVEDSYETAERLADGLVARGQKHKVLFIAENYGAEKRRFVQDQLKSMQASGMWDEDAIDKFKEDHEGVYLL